MKLFFTKLCLYIFPVFLFMVVMNQANVSSGIEKRIAEYLSDGYNVKNVPAIDDRLLQKHVIEGLSSAPSPIILGASTVMQLGNDFYGPNCLNNAVSGGSIEDLIAIYQLYIENGYSPDKVVIGVSHYTFNKNNTKINKKRWKTLSKEYYDFFGLNYSFLKRISKYEQLLFPSYFQASMRNTLRFTKIEPTNENINDTFTRLIDGTIAYDLKYRSLTEQAVEREMEKALIKRRDAEYRDLSEDILEQFSLFITTLKEHQTEIEFLLIPLYSIAYNYIGDHEEYQGTLKTEEYIKKYAAQNNIPLKGSFNPAPFGLETRDFYDGFHLKKEGLKKVLQ